MTINPLIVAFCLAMTKVKIVFPHLKDLGDVPFYGTVWEDLENRIAGGDPTSLIEYPFNVKFFNFGAMCGGVILTSKCVLTAAHCFDVNTNIAEMKIVSNSEKVFDRRSVMHDIWDFILHERYSEKLVFANDIAVVIIHDSFTFGPKVQRAILTNTSAWMNEKEKHFIVTGWGEDGKLKINSHNIMKKAYLRYIPDDECIERNRIHLSPDMFCLYGDGSRDTCRGDSGGGVLWKNEIVGIVSHGKGCGKKPGVYANVFYLKTWIEENVHKLYDRFCQFHKADTYF